MTNRKRLEKAGLLKAGAELSPEQKKALESLTKQEVDALISSAKKLRKVFPPKPSEDIGTHIRTHHLTDDDDDHNEQ